MNIQKEKITNMIRKNMRNIKKQILKITRNVMIYHRC